MDELKARAVISRLLVIESAQAAGLLVAAPVGSGGGDVLLVASREPRDDGTLACVLVRIYVRGLEHPDQVTLALPPERGAWLAFVGSGVSASDDAEQIYLVPGVSALEDADWQSAGFKATPERWASLFGSTPDSISS
jgi:hypothetical protein